MTPRASHDRDADQTIGVKVFVPPVFAATDLSSCTSAPLAANHGILFQPYHVEDAVP